MDLGKKLGDRNDRSWINARTWLTSRFRGGVISTSLGRARGILDYRMSLDTAWGLWPALYIKSEEEWSGKVVLAV